MPNNPRNEKMNLEQGLYKMIHENNVSINFIYDYEQRYSYDRQIINDAKEIIEENKKLIKNKCSLMI